MRLFRAGTRLSGKPLSAALSMVFFYPSADAAASDLALTRRGLASKAGRQQFVKGFTTGFVCGVNLVGGKLKVSKMVVGAPVSVGAAALRIPVTITTNRGSLRAALAYAQVDRVAEIVWLSSGLGGTLAAADVVHAIGATEAHARTAFTLTSTAAPTVSGTPTPGQTLAVDEGDWTGAPSAFGYAWARCDASGATCTPIEGASASTYTVSPADVGFSLRVTVIGSNSVSSLDIPSAATAVVQ